MNCKKIKKQLSVWSRALAKENLVCGTSGNISAKQGIYIYIKKTGASFYLSKASDFIDIHKTDKASIEWKMHKACYAARKDISAVVHTHPMALLILQSLKIKIKPITMDFPLHLKKGIKQIQFCAPGSAKFAEIIKKSAYNYNAILIAHHGLVTLGKSLKQACLTAIIAEREAKIILAAKILSKNPSYMTKKQIKLIYKI